MNTHKVQNETNTEEIVDVIRTLGLLPEKEKQYALGVLHGMAMCEGLKDSEEKSN